MSSLQLGVLAFACLWRGCGVDVFPEHEEIFVCGVRPDAGCIGIRVLRRSETLVAS